MSVSIFASPNCDYCSLQKDCEIKLDKRFNSNFFEALKKM